MSAKIQQLPTVVLKPKPIFRFDKQKEGLTLVENVGLGDGEVILRFDEFLKRKERSVKGTVMLDRAKKMGNLAGQLHAERLLEQQKEIPSELWGFHLVFPGTVWSMSPDRLWIPFFHCSDTPKYKWSLGLSCLINDFNSAYRLVRLCQ